MRPDRIVLTPTWVRTRRWAARRTRRAASRRRWRGRRRRHHRRRRRRRRRRSTRSRRRRPGRRSTAAAWPALLPHPTRLQHADCLGPLAATHSAASHLTCSDCTEPGTLMASPGRCLPLTSTWAGACPSAMCTSSTRAGCQLAVWSYHTHCTTLFLSTFVLSTMKARRGRYQAARRLRRRTRARRRPPPRPARAAGARPLPPAAAAPARPHTPAPLPAREGRAWHAQCKKPFS